MKVRGKALWVALVGCTVGATEARAFVRETTGYTSGTPLAWSSGCVVIAVPNPRSSMVTWDDLLTATAAAASAWNVAAANCGGGFRFDVQKAQASGLGVANDAVNAVLFRTNNYCAGRSDCDPASPAITWFYDVDRTGAGDDGRVLETDTEIKGVNGAPGVMDLETVLTHELGHVLGLDHNCYESGFGLPRPIDNQGNPLPDCGDTAPASVKASVMYPQSGLGRVQRTLSDDDIRGVCSIYPSGTRPECQGQLAPGNSDDRIAARDPISARLMEANRRWKEDHDGRPLRIALLELLRFLDG